MIGKLPVLGFALVTAISGQALAHDSHGPRDHRHGGYQGGAPSGYQRGYEGNGRVDVDLRHADFNRDGWVTMQEALDSGRQVFRRNDRDNNRVLSRREAGRGGFRYDDRNNDGRVSMREYQRTVRAQFARLDSNRDGYLARHELGYGRPGPSRAAGWWR